MSFAVVDAIAHKGTIQARDVCRRFGKALRSQGFIGARAILRQIVNDEGLIGKRASQPYSQRVLRSVSRRKAGASHGAVAGKGIGTSRSNGRFCGARFITVRRGRPLPRLTLIGIGMFLAVIALVLYFGGFILVDGVHPAHMSLKIYVSFIAHSIMTQN